LRSKAFSFTSASGSRIGNGRSTKALKKVNAAVLMPIPNANVAIAIAAKAGFLPRRRTA
jgi:hypothetical protein